MLLHILVVIFEFWRHVIYSTKHNMTWWMVCIWCPSWV